MTTAPAARIDLSHFTGTEGYHVTTLRGRAFLVTDGVLHLMKEAGAFWLADAVASHQSARVVQVCQGFEVWRLRKLPDGSKNAAALECWTDTPGRSYRAAYQLIPYTDFPWDRLGVTEFQWYVEGAATRDHPAVMLLKSEH